MPISPDRRYKTVYLFRGLWSACSHLFAEGVARETERTRWCHHGFGPPVLLKLTGEKLPSNLVVGWISVATGNRASWMSFLTRTCIITIWKGSCISPTLVLEIFLYSWDSRKANTSRFLAVSHAKKNKENLSDQGIFLRLGLPFCLIRHGNEPRRKGGRDLKPLPFVVDRKHFENETFRSRRARDNHVIPLPEFSSNTNLKWPVIVAFLIFHRVVWT